MIKLMVSVYDKVAKEHGEIVFVKNPDVAKRFFNNEVLAKVHNQDDYELYAHGYFDTDSGVITDLRNELCFKPDVIEIGE